MVNEIIFFILPLLIVGVLHHFIVIRLNLCSFLAKPIDSNYTLYGKRIFGNSKTWRGLIIVIIGTGFFMWLESRYLTGIHLKLNSFLAGAILGSGYALAELPNSFLKRRLGILESKQSDGLAGKLFSFFDQIDSVAGSIIVLPLIYNPTLVLAGYFLLIGGLIHWIVDSLLYRFSYKKISDQPG